MTIGTILRASENFKAKNECMFSVLTIPDSVWCWWSLTQGKQRNWSEFKRQEVSKILVLSRKVIFFSK